MNKRRRIYEGKAKVLFEGPEPGTLVQYFKDDATAFNNQKRGYHHGQRGPQQPDLRVPDDQARGDRSPDDFVRRLNMREQLVREVEIIPIELVVRNFAAGSLSKRFGIPERDPASALDHGILLQVG